MSKDKLSSVPGSSPAWEHLEPWVRQQIQGLLQGVLEEEVTALLGRFRYERQGGVEAPVGYRNGYGKPRRVSLMCGTVEVRRPRVRGLEGRFESRLLPLFARRTKEVTELLPQLYLHGLSQGDFELALRGLLGEGAPLSSASIARLRAKWEEEYEAWRTRRLEQLEVVYCWADGIYVKAGLEKDKAAILVIIAALSDGRKEVLCLEPGFRESTESWKRLLRDLRDRGLRQAPKLLVADGHLGIWAAVGEVWPETTEQRCWNHRLVNILDHLKKEDQAAAKEVLRRIPLAPTQRAAEARRDQFAAQYRDRYPQAVACLETDWERMVAFYAFPEAHWRHLRTTNPVESPFAAVRLRTDAAKRFKRVPGATALIWRVMRVAEQRFRCLDAADVLPAIYAGQQYCDGKPMKKHQPTQKKEAA